jgi:hypothetical protein
MHKIVEDDMTIVSFKIEGNDDHTLVLEGLGLAVVGRGL